MHVLLIWFIQRLQENSYIINSNRNSYGMAEHRSQVISEQEMVVKVYLYSWENRKHPQGSMPLAKLPVCSEVSVKLSQISWVN